MIVTLQTLVFFREALINALDRILRPYYNKFSLTFGRNGEVSDDDDSDEQVFADFDEEKGVVFYPPVYLQRYAAVTDCLMDERWCGKLEKVVDLGYHDMSFIKYLKEVSGIRCILGVDIESIPLHCSSDLVGCDEYGPKRENPLQVTLFQGNAADPDYRLIGCDAVIGIEMIEHMLPQDLDRLIHTVFGFIKPWTAIFTTPNRDFNVLFKAMEKNGLRRWDHFFEWSREQFNDWCSNIVARYPEYSVICKGIGPGPPGTLHHGCCSQMALFVSKNYVKQQDLNLDSLALVAHVPNNVSTIFSTWESSESPNEANMICAPDHEESFIDLYSEQQSFGTIILKSLSTFSISELEYQDKTSQCNLDIEAAKNYMFECDMCWNVLIPRRKNDNQVYMIEDVNRRLNCSTLLVTKFSKATQLLIAKNKVDSLVHTREVVAEIRNLTKMLNFNKDSEPLQNGVHMWHNINWGDNAPYWNQYYKVVREYNPPYESKSEESRITELISDEINRLIDNQFDDTISNDLNRMEIPIDHLMSVVAHITNDTEKVKDLLEWDGYEIVDNVVIHSRLIVDNASTTIGVPEDDWLDNDTCSDWDSTDVHSTTLSDGSTMVPDYHARCLRRALDHKVRKLRTMLTADDDITTELDRIVCQLMKLALRTSRGRCAPPPTRWMQCKLLDLLTLTEKAIERRKKHFLESYPMKAITYEDPVVKSQNMAKALEKIKEDDSALKIVDKYRHLVKENRTTTKDSRAKYRFIDLELVDDLSATTPELEDFDYIERHSPSLLEPEPTLTDMASYNPADEKTKLERTKAWIEDDLESVTHRDTNFDDISSGDTEHSTSLTRYYKKSYKKYKAKKSPCLELKCVVCKRSHSNNVVNENKKDKKIKDKTSKTKITKKMRKKASNNDMLKDNSKKYVSVDYRHYRFKSRKKEFKSLQPTASKPIPASLIELCHPEFMVDTNLDMYKEHIINYNRDDYVMQSNQSGSVAITEKSVLIDIVMDDIQETIAMKRTIGTDADGDPMGYETETLIRSVSNTMIDNYFDKNDVGIENDETIFLNDINEPSTSKGIRHVSMDVQCGPATTAPSYSRLSATTSITRMPNIFTASIKIEDSSTDTEIKNTGYNAMLQKRSTNCCTSTGNEDVTYKTITPRERTNGIKIIESIPDFTQSVPTTMAPENKTVMKELMTSMMREQEMYMIRELEMFKIKNQDLAATQNQEIQDNSNEVKEKQELITMTSKTHDISQTLVQGHDLKLQKTFTIETQRIEPHSIQMENSTGSQVHEPLTLQNQRSTEVQEQEPLTISEQRSARMQEYVPHIMRAQSPSIMQGQESPTIRAQSLSKIPLTVQVKVPITAEQEQKSLTIRELSLSQIEENEPDTIEIRNSIRMQAQNHLTVELQGSTGLQEQETPGIQSSEKIKELNPSIIRTQIPSPMQKQEPLTLPIQNPSNIQGQSPLSARVQSPIKTQQEPHTMRLTSPNMIQEQEMHTMRVHIPGKARQVQEACVMEKHNTNITHEQEMFIMRERFIQDDESDRTNVSSPDFLTRHSSSPSRKYDDSGSDFCRSFASFPSPTSCLTNDVPNSSKSRGVGSSRKLTRYVRPKLCCGGVQVHSYRDKQTSEDIMYQGEWQNPRPKVYTNRKVFNPVIIKKITDTTLKKKVSSKEKITAKRFVNHISKVESPKSLHTRKAVGLLDQPNVEQSQRLSIRTSGRVAKVRPIRSITKVPSKVTMSSVTSKTSNSTRLVKKSSVTIISSSKGEQQNATIAGKEYLPYYLRKKAIKPCDKKNLNLKDIVNSNIFTKKKTLRAKTVIKGDLLKFQSKVPSSNFVVLRNEVEVEKKSSTNEGQSTKTTPEGGGRWIIPVAKRSLSPQSQTSSTCSSPSSIATVRAKNMTSRRHSASTCKTSSSNSVSEDSTPNSNKKFTKRCKTAKMSDKKKIEDKENIPQTSRQINVISKESDKIGKGTFLSQKKEVFIAQLKESPPLQSANKIPKCNAKILKKNSVSEKRTASPSSSKNVSFKSDELNVDNVNSIPVSTEISNVVLVIEPHRLETQKQISDSQPNTPNVVNSRLITEWLNHCDESHTSNVRAAMRMLVEETLDFIDVSNDNINSSIDSDTVVLSRDDFNNGADLCSSPISFKTIITNENNSLQSNLEQAVNQTFGDDSFSLNDTRLAITDLDLLSFKSVTSVSKYSDYLSADSSQSKLPLQPVCKSSIKDIYERKDQPFVHISQNSAGAAAVQAFSGFSLNGEPPAGDKLDPINCIDSETGSLAVNIPRQANSEELFVSGRSSGSFESYVLDEDIVVPSWLFQIISEQEEADAEHQPEPMVVLPMPEDEYDANGNVVESVGLSAGAGDGRGMHSDASQDSSGQGTSLSSTATSSGAQSEAILIDPSAYASFDADALRDSEDDSFIVVGFDDGGSEMGPSQVAAPTVPESHSFSHGEVTRRIPRVFETTASDIDADVSSLETDVLDSDN